MDKLPCPDGNTLGRRRLMRAGQLIEISSGGRRAIITEQGATLFRLLWDDVEVLDTAAEDGYAGAGCHGQLLMPWPGRVRDGTYVFEGQTYELSVNDRSHRAAIHGWARWDAWQVKEHRGDRLTMGLRILATPGYPFALDVEQIYAWRRDGLECITTVKNLSDDTAPFGFGAHPYFTLGAPTIDSGVLQLPASQYFRAEEDLTPKLPALTVEGTEFDFRQPKPVGNAILDVTFTGLQRDGEGNAVSKFSAPDGSRTITLKFGEQIDFIQVFSGDTLSEGRRAGLAIEPYTSAPDAFNNGLGLVRLAPGASVRMAWSVSVSG